MDKTIGREGGARPTNLGTKIWHFFLTPELIRFAAGVYEYLRANKTLAAWKARTLCLARIAIAEKGLVWPGLQCCQDIFLSEFCHRLIKFQLKNLENNKVLGGNSKNLSLRTNLNAVSSATKKRKTRSSDKLMFKKNFEKKCQILVPRFVGRDPPSLPMDKTN